MNERPSEALAILTEYKQYPGSHGGAHRPVAALPRRFALADKADTPELKLRAKGRQGRGL
ncbi:MAG: hypothetical protein HC857_14625, partial [Synechococcales cyanobacterium RU_4_20]|nr:hypothetical protein [Synechococcales cyanobacterium RU_4_20]